MIALELNKVVKHYGRRRALDGLSDALGKGGVEASTGRPLARPEGAPEFGAVSGDGATREVALGVLRTTDGPPSSSLRLLVRPEHDAVRPGADPHHVVLYRRVDGTACSSVRHVPRHSPTGCSDRRQR